MSESYFIYSSSAKLLAQKTSLDDFFSESLYDLECQLNGGGPDSEVTMNLERVMAGSLPMMKNTQSGPISLQVSRTWRGVRRDCKLYVLLWFPCKGSLAVQQNNYNEIISEKDFLLTCSNRPYQIETIPDENSEHESLAIALPLHVANTYFLGSEQLGGCRLSLDKGDALFAKQTCLNLYDFADEMPAKTSMNFLNACLEACSDAIQHKYEEQKQNNDIKQVRFQAIVDYINNNLTTPGLTSNRVADACNISSRYLHLLLKENDIFFHDFVWKKRLELAHEWLSNKNKKVLLISTIANNAGFKSISHFSRSFKSEYGYTPSDLRDAS